MTNQLEKYKNSVEVGCCKLVEILQSGISISIPDYQRAYVWDSEKIRTLFEDLKNHLEDTKNKEYFIGSILFHKKNKNEYEIIDGQQRLTTILIIDYVVNHTNAFVEKEYLRFNFNSPLSKKNIIENKLYIESNHKYWLNDNWNHLFSQLVVSTIITTNQDDAFTFFESQNNRGVKLSSVDFLKSYHLREIKGDIDKQKVFAKNWDANNKNQFLDGLYNKVLWRGRKWKGNRVDFVNTEEILLEFQKNTNPKNENFVSIYPNVKNKLSESICFDTNEGISMLSSKIPLQIKAIDLPFALRQPLQKGIGFFLYTEKYSQLYQKLFIEFRNQNNKNVNNEVSKLYDFFNSVYLKSNLSTYLIEFFQLCLVIYYDKFDNKELFKCAQYIDYLIGSYRISYASIVELTPMKIVRDNEINLLDVISNAFTPDEVFNFIIELTKNENYKSEEIKIDHTVKGRYKKAVLEYYEKEILENVEDKGINQLKERLSWIY